MSNDIEDVPYGKGRTFDPKLNMFAKDLIKEFERNPNINIMYTFRQLAKKYKFPGQPRTNDILDYLFNLGYTNPELCNQLVKKRSRGGIGVMVIATVTKGLDSCPNDCHYCPDQPSLNGKPKPPRSYIDGEPAVERGYDVNFDPFKQFRYRADQYFCMGHPVDKISLIVLGGTWTHYPIEYQNEYIGQSYYAANTLYDTYNHATKTFDDTKLRPYQGWKMEVELNQHAKCSIVELTLETRPDHITKTAIKRFRSYGVTRIQVGVQHTDDEILDHINRGCKDRHTQKAIRLLKQSGYKVDIHVMPDLPGSTPEKDIDMWDKIISNENYCPDQVKIYPCQTTPYTKILEWYQEGSYVPYSYEDLTNLLVVMMTRAPRWMRLNRVVRDIPKDAIRAGCPDPQMRNILNKRIKDLGLKVVDIRERQISTEYTSLSEFHLNVVEYDSCDGVEFFIEYINDDDKLAGFLRLRLEPNPLFIDLEGCAIIRELHVYGEVRVKGATGGNVQHRGVGTILVNKAKEIAWKHHYNKIAVISGVGVREYYKRKHGFTELTPLGYLVCDMSSESTFKIWHVITLVFFALFVVWYLQA